MNLSEIGLNLFLRSYHLVPALLILLPGLSLGIWSYRRLKVAFRDERLREAQPRTTGRQAAEAFLRGTGDPNPSRVVTASGPLATFYDPARGELRLAEVVAASGDPASLAVAILEAGHAARHRSDPWLIRARTPLAFAAALGSNAAWLILISAMVMDDAHLAMTAALLHASSVMAAMLLTCVALHVSRTIRRTTEGGVEPNHDPAPVLDRLLNVACWDHVAATLPLTTIPASTGIVAHRAARRPDVPDQATIS